MQLLASGGSDNAAISYSVRPFKPLFALVGSVREFGKWCRSHPERELELVIHVVDESVQFEVASGRLDVDELLSSIDLRFWVKLVYPDGRIQRHMCQELEDVRIGELTRWIGLEADQWAVESIPHVGTSNEPRKRLVSTIQDEPLSSCVIPGGTLRFTIGRA